jgi:hypothetical protein
MAIVRRKLRRLRGVDSWPSTEAEVLSCEREESDSGDSPTYYYCVKFSFNVNERHYTSSFDFTAGGTGRLFAPGDKVQIQFNPKNPENTVYSEAWTDGEKFWPFATLACLIFLAHWIITGSPWFSSSQ